MKTTPSDPQPLKVNPTKIHPSSRKAIKNLILVLVGGVGSALLLACFMIYYYGPTGTYFVRNVLLSPSLTSSLSYQDRSPKTGKVEKYTFEGVDFSSGRGNNLQPEALSLNQYEQFYKLIENDKSFAPVSEELLKDFGKTAPAILRLKVKTGSDTKVFQEVVILPNGDYYRILLRQENAGENWAYYHHPHIYEQTLRLFTGKP